MGHCWPGAISEHGADVLQRAHAAIIVYDVTVQRTFDDVDSWVKQLKPNVDDKLVLCIVGNKNDLGNKVVQLGVAEAYAKKANALFLESSAKNDVGIGDMFVQIAKGLLVARGDLPGETTGGQGSVRVTSQPGNTEKAQCCR